MRILIALLFPAVSLVAPIFAQQYSIARADFDIAARKFCGLHTWAKGNAHRDRLITQVKHEPATDDDSTLTEILETDAEGRTHFIARLVKPNERTDVESIRIDGLYFSRSASGQWVMAHSRMPIERWAIEKRKAIDRSKINPLSCTSQTSYWLDIVNINGRMAYVYSRVAKQDPVDTRNASEIAMEMITSYWLTVEGAPLRSQSLMIERQDTMTTIRSRTIEHEWDPSILIQRPSTVGPQ